MANASLTSKGQTTIPKEVRDALKLQAKDQLSFTLMPDGTVLMRAKTASCKIWWAVPTTAAQSSPPSKCS